jgi:outer membrane lipoprotein-sorting protein
VSARRRRSSSLALLLAALTAGCATALPAPRESIPGDVRRAVDTLRARWGEFDDLRTLADITIERGGQRQRLTGVLLVQRPASVRFEALSPFGQPFLFVIVHEGRVMTYNATTNEATVAPATAESTARLVGLPFEPGDLVAALAGYAVPPNDLRAAEFLDPDELGGSLMLYGAVNKKRVWLEPATGVVRQQEIVGGRYEVRATYDRAPDGLVAGITISAAQSQLTGELKYRNTVLDGGVDPDRFNFRLPNGARVHRLD